MIVVVFMGERGFKRGKEIKGLLLVLINVLVILVVVFIILLCLKECKRVFLGFFSIVFFDKIFFNVV